MHVWRRVIASKYGVEGKPSCGAHGLSFWCIIEQDG